MYMDYEEFMICCDNKVFHNLKFNTSLDNAKEIAKIANGSLYQWNEDFYHYLKIFDAKDENFDPADWLFENFRINEPLTIDELI